MSWLAARSSLSFSAFWEVFMSVFRILFVCHGNICRSPMAEFVMKNMVAQKGASARIYVESAATTNDEIGHAVHPGTRKKLDEAGISCAGKTARRITQADYEAFDLILGMDDENMRDLMRFYAGDPQGKIKKFMEFAGSARSVADPWFTGNFDETYDDVVAGCAGLCEWLQL
jgi:protein-tyrosine phosphatase